jgi:uroporphyrinogen decarboxylase
MGDDMGHRSGTMIKPQHLRKYVFPLQKRIAEMCHERGLLFLMHSCGRLDEIVDDLIEDVGIDAKHSFEDTITPVEEFLQEYSDRVAVIGGVDVDLLARGHEDLIRARVHQILEVASQTGAYAMGSGNSVTNYIPPENFLVMVDECHRFNQSNWT